MNIIIRHNHKTPSCIAKMLIGSSMNFGKRQGSTVKVVLLESYESLGAQGDIVGVKAGFARNFLIPKKKAIYHSKYNSAATASASASNSNTSTSSSSSHGATN
jgi:hypothetical protein